MHYSGDGGVHATLRFETLEKALEKKRRRENEEKERKEGEGKSERTEKGGESKIGSKSLLGTTAFIGERVHDFLFQENDNFPDSNVLVRESTSRGSGILPDYQGTLL